MEMFCYQCEQAARGKGCTTAGVCGKAPETAALQDVLLHQLRGVAKLALALGKTGSRDPEVDRFVIKGLFSTVTNVNFDNDRLQQLIRRGEALTDSLYERLGNRVPPPRPECRPGKTLEALLAQAPGLGVSSEKGDEDVKSLKQLLIYGLKGMAAYVDHADILGKTDDAVFDFVLRALAELNKGDITQDALLKLCLRCGEMNIRAMELLDQGHTETYGHPAPAQVSTGTRKGPAIVVTGHDMADLKALLEQSEGTGINIYTHGEMLPAHGYPELRRHEHLAGHFGTAWQNQRREFDNIPAAVLFTTNCIQAPGDTYLDRVFTTGLVAWPGVRHLPDRDFSAIMEKAGALPGFEESEGKKLLTGFGHNAVLGVADKVIEAVKAGAIKHFLLVGGCDGAKPGRNYYTEIVEKAPADTVILTLACGKFRFNHLELGDIGGIPRLLDIGQCNDAYGAVKIAQALAGAFDCGINDLPLSLVLSWYEQKACVILLSLLALGVKNIRLGPTLPAFISPNVLDLLVSQYNIKPIATAEEDLAAILQL